VVQFYFGIGVGVTWQRMRSRLRRHQLWLLFAVGIISDFVLEAILSHFDTYYCYDWQALVVFKCPMWWGAINFLITMMAGAAGNTVAGWPFWLVINTYLDTVLTQFGGILAFVAAGWITWLMIEWVASTLRKTVPVGARLLPLAR
jgi:hypothetical protein